jgi:hypothetical protein
LAVSDHTVSRAPVEKGDRAIDRKEAYLRQVVAEVEELAARVGILKAQIAKQNSGVTPEHRWELPDVRNRFRDFKRCAEELEEASEENWEEARKASELAWNDLRHAVDELLCVPPVRAAHRR